MNQTLRKSETSPAWFLEALARIDPLLGVAVDRATSHFWIIRKNPRNSSQPFRILKITAPPDDPAGGPREPSRCDLDELQRMDAWKLRGGRRPGAAIERMLRDREERFEKERQNNTRELERELSECYARGISTTRDLSKRTKFGPSGLLGRGASK